MNMFLHELKSNRKSTMIWICSLVGVTILFMSMFPSISKESAGLEQIMNNFPEEIRLAFGLTSFNLSTLLGFYGYIFTYIVLCGAIQAMNLGISILSIEVREKTADFLLTKPVARKQIISSKLLAALTCIIITNIIFIISAFLSAEAVKTESYSIKVFFMVSITLLFVQLIFLALGVIISAAINKIKSVLPISLGVVFGLFIINLFGSVIGDDKIRYITPFKYFDISYIIEKGSYEISFLILSLILIVAFVTGSYILYIKKDVSAF